MDTLQPQQAPRHGMSRSALYRAAQAGQYDRIGRGIYRAADAPAADWDWIEAATRRQDATICLMSALARHELTDAIPEALDVAIPRGSRIPSSRAAIAWHTFDKDTFNLGRSMIAIPGTDQHIGLYSPERCIVDLFRLRGEFGYELGRDALRAWLQRSGKPAHLIAIAAQIPRAKGPVLHALDMLA